MSSTLYVEYLQGKRSNFRDQLANITYNDIVIDIKSYLTRVTIGWNNGTFTDYTKYSKSLPKRFYSSLDGFARNMFLKCYGLEVIKTFKKDIAIVYTYYEAESVLGRMFNLHGRVFSLFQYAKQILHSPSSYPILHVEENNRTQSTLMHHVTDMEILQRRNKRKDQCTYDWESFDVLNVEKHIEYHGCRPPYLATSSNHIGICKTQRSLQESVYVYEGVSDKYLKKPCQSMTRIDFSLNDKNIAFPPADNEIGIGIHYPLQYRHIVQSQAVDGHSLIGNMGGYIGLFLGSSS